MNEDKRYSPDTLTETELLSQLYDISQSFYVGQHLLTTLRLQTSTASFPEWVHLESMIVYRQHLLEEVMCDCLLQLLEQSPLP